MHCGFLIFASLGAQPFEQTTDTDNAPWECAYKTNRAEQKYPSTHHLYMALIMNTLQEASVDWSYFSRLSLHALLRYIINSLIINKINRGRIILLRTAEVHGEV